MWVEAYYGSLYLQHRPKKNVVINITKKNNFFLTGELASSFFILLLHLIHALIYDRSL